MLLLYFFTLVLVLSHLCDFFYVAHDQTIAETSFHTDHKWIFFLVFLVLLFCYLCADSLRALSKNDCRHIIFHTDDTYMKLDWNESFYVLSGLMHAKRWSHILCIRTDQVPRAFSDGVYSGHLSAWRFFRNCHKRMASPQCVLSDVSLDFPILEILCHKSGKRRAFHLRVSSCVSSDCLHDLYVFHTCHNWQNNIRNGTSRVV